MGINCQEAEFDGKSAKAPSKGAYSRSFLPKVPKWCLKPYFKKIGVADGNPVYFIGRDSRI